MLQQPANEQRYPGSRDRKPSGHMTNEDADGPRGEVIIPEMISYDHAVMYVFMA